MITHHALCAYITKRDGRCVHAAAMGVKYFPVEADTKVGIRSTEHTGGVIWLFLLGSGTYEGTTARKVRGKMEGRHRTRSRSLDEREPKCVGGVL